MEIRYFKLFIDELYQTTLPRWFYFLLGLIHGGVKKKNLQPLSIQEQNSFMQQNELMKIIHLTPNISVFQANL